MEDFKAFFTSRGGYGADKELGDGPRIRSALDQLGHALEAVSAAEERGAAPTEGGAQAASCLLTFSVKNLVFLHGYWMVLLKFGWF